MRKQIAIIDTGENGKTEPIAIATTTISREKKVRKTSNELAALIYGEHHWMSITTKMGKKRHGRIPIQPRLTEHSTDIPKMKTIPALISEIVCEMLQKKERERDLIENLFFSLSFSLSQHSVFADILFYRWFCLRISLEHHYHQQQQQQQQQHNTNNDKTANRNRKEV